MSQLIAARMAATCLGLLLAACGGGTPDTGVSSASGSTATTTLLPGPTYGLGSANVAPPDGATLSGIVRLEVQGYHMANVELLPAEGYSPKYGTFNVLSGYEFSPQHGWLDLDTTRLPNGPVRVRISGFDAPAGQSGNEFSIMGTRTWNISNTGSPAPLSAAVSSAPANGAVISGIARLEVRGSGLANVELLPASGYSPRLGSFNVSADRTTAWLDFDSRSVPDGVRGVRISAFNVMQGQADATEAVAMPARQWNIQNGAAQPPITASLSIAPAHGAVVEGSIFLEVRGTGLKNVELLPANGYTPKLGKFTITTDGTYASLSLDANNLPAGANEVRIVAFNKLPGEANAREVVVMPARQWNVRH